MIDVVRDSGAAAVIMHMQGEPRSMQDAPSYEDVVGDISLFFEERLKAASAPCLSFTLKNSCTTLTFTLNVSIDLS